LGSRPGGSECVFPAEGCELDLRADAEALVEFIDALAERTPLDCQVVGGRDEDADLSLVTHTVMIHCGERTEHSSPGSDRAAKVLAQASRVCKHTGDVANQLQVPAGLRRPLA